MCGIAGIVDFGASEPKENLLLRMLGRDRVGIRPLFFYHEGGYLVFGSEIKALFADPSVPRILDFESLSDIFTAWAPLGPLTPFNKVYQLLPGHYALFSLKGMQIRPYWELSFSESGSNDRPLDEWVEALSALLYDATRIRLRADVPVGAYLSGGLDSTTITSLVKRFFDNKLRTFSVSFTIGSPCSTFPILPDGRTQRGEEIWPLKIRGCQAFMTNTESGGTR